jgi:hypothetical protein
MSTESAAHNEIMERRAFSAHTLNYLFPGLTAGPIHFQPFGPQTKKPNLDKLSACIAPASLRSIGLLDVLSQSAAKLQGACGAPGLIKAAHACDRTRT